MGCSRYLFDGFRVPPILSPLQNAADSRERVELYEAAQIIQHAFRLYKKRQRLLRQLEEEKQHRHAAVVIQSYYRRYKQYCYFKKLQHAALVIQKYFRKHKATTEAATNGAQEKNVENKGQVNTVNENIIICSNEKFHVNNLTKRNDSILDSIEEKAAMIIQNAFRTYYRNHRQKQRHQDAVHIQIGDNVADLKHNTKKRPINVNNEEPTTKRMCVERA